MSSAMKNANAWRITALLIGLIGLSHGVSAQFVHPGMWATGNELETIRYRVEHNVQPQKAAFETLRSEFTSSLSWTPTAVTYVNVGAYNNPKINYDTVVDNSRAAWAQAILWSMTGNDQYAENVLAILDTHARNFTSIQGSNARLFAGWVGKNWYKAMDLLKSGYAGWDPEIETRFNEMFNRVYYPLCNAIDPYGANWDFYCMETLMAAAIFQERTDWFDKCLSVWSTLLPGYIAPYGESAETCRDLGHAWMGLAAAVRIAEMAWKQGYDLYDDYDSLLLTGLEFHAKYTLSNGGICTECGQYDGFGFDQFTNVNGTVIMLNMANPNEKAMSWEIAYNHYHNRRNFDMPNSYAVMMSVRSLGILRWGDGPGTLFFADMDFGTLMVEVRQPDDGLWLQPGDDVTFEVEVESVVSVADQVEFYDGDLLLGTASEAPFTFTWNSVPEGLHEVVVRALDSEGNEGIGFVDLVVQSVPPRVDVRASGTQDPETAHPHLTMDGDLDTAWSAYGLGQSLTFDLNCVRTLSSMEMAFASGDLYDYGFAVAVSVGGLDWTTLYNGNSGLAGVDLVPFELPDHPARYVRVIGNGNQSNRWNWYSEVVFHFTDGLPAVATNLAPRADAGPDLSRTLPDNTIRSQGAGFDIDGSIVSYHWEQIDGPFCIIGAPDQAYLEVSNLEAGTYRFRLTVVDNENAEGQDELMVVIYPPSDDGEVVYSINCGGPATMTAAGLPLIADTYFSGGDALSKSDSISGTDDPQIYQNYRNGIFSYAFPVSNGTYSVLLQTMESYWTETNKRRFSVEIEGVPVIDNIDLIALLGGKFIAYDRTFITEVKDGTLNMVFKASIDKAIACAIVIREVVPDVGLLNVGIAHVSDDGALTLQCPSKIGHTYQLFSTNDPAGDSWQLLESKVGTGEPIEFVSPPLSGAQQFFRIVRY